MKRPDVLIERIAKRFNDISPEGRRKILDYITYLEAQLQDSERISVIPASEVTEDMEVLFYGDWWPVRLAHSNHLRRVVTFEVDSEHSYERLDTELVTVRPRKKELTNEEIVSSVIEQWVPASGAEISPAILEALEKNGRLK